MYDKVASDFLNLNVTGIKYFSCILGRLLVFSWKIAITLFGYDFRKILCMAIKQFLQLYYELKKGHFYEKFLWYGREFRQFPYYKNS